MWLDAYDSPYYNIRVNFEVISQDPVGNYSRVRMNAIAIRSKDSDYSFYNDYGTANTGLAIAGKDGYEGIIHNPLYFKTGGKITTVYKEFWFDLPDRYVYHNPDGNLTVNLSNRFDSIIGGFQVPYYGWRDIQYKLPWIDRNRPDFTPKWYATTNTQIKLQINNDHAIMDQISYRLNGGAWKTSNLSLAAYTTGYLLIDGLEPNTSYNCEIQNKRAWNQVWSTSRYLTFKTDADAPYGVTARTINVGINSAQIDISTHSGKNNPVNGYGYAISGRSFVGYYSSSIINISNLSPNTTYTLTPYARSQNGKVSTGSTLTFKTDSLPPTIGNMSWNSKGVDYLNLNLGKVNNQVALSVKQAILYNAQGTEIQRKTVSANTEAIIFSGLTDYTNYIAKTYVKDVAGKSVYSNSFSIKTKAKVQKPIIEKLLITNSSIKVQAKAASKGNIIKYLFSKDGEKTTVVSTGGTFTFSGLTPATSYNLTVRAETDEGIISDISNTLTLTTYPAKPVIRIKETIRGVKNIHFIMEHIKTKNSKISKYLVRTYEKGQLVKPEETFTNSTFNVVGLKPNHTYTFSINAIDTYGQVSESVVVTIKTKIGKWARVSENGSTYELVNVWIINEKGEKFLVDKEMLLEL